MKKAVFAVVAVAVASVFAMPSFAEKTNQPAKSTAPKAHEFTGTITTLDAAKGSVTIKNNKGEEKTFAADKAKINTADKSAKAGATLVDLKVGEKVTASYTEDAGNLTAVKIVQVTEKAKAPAPAPATK